MKDHLKRFMMSMDRDALETQMIGEKLSSGDTIRSR
jgi:hypothetical protein